MISVLIQTDLPEPVAPAINRWGIFAISDTTTFPLISFPVANASLEGWFLNSSDSSRSRSATALFSEFGTSIPMAAFPGIGASIRISDAARFSFISSDRETMRLTFIPCSGCSSYLVTLGPQLTFVIVTLTPKLSKVCWSFAAVLRISCSCPFAAFPFPLFNKVRGGKTYCGRTFSAAFAISASTEAIPSSISFWEERGFFFVGADPC